MFKKRIFTAAAALVVVMGMLAGCAGGGQKDAENSGSTDTSSGKKTRWSFPYG